MCPRCNEEKEVTDFYKRDKKHAASFCKDCFNKYCMKRWQDKKIKAIESFGNTCLDCKQSFHPNVYEFHHLRDKDNDWGTLRLKKQSAIDAELSKCVLLCANCHRIRHIV